MNTATKKAAPVSLDSLLDDVSTPKRNRPIAPGSSAGRASNLSSSPVPINGTPSRPIAPGPSRLHNSSPANGSPSTPSVPFASRAHKLAVQESLNGDLDLPTSSQRVGDKPRVLLSSTTDPSTYNYRIAYEKPMERSEALDKQIDEAAEAFRDYYGIDDFGDPGAQSQEDIMAIGRLCPESDNAKMTETSTWLESSRMLGSGSRVLLKFDGDMKVRHAPPGSGGMGMFAGCLVGVKGRNGGGKLFAVNEIWMMPPIDPSYSRPSEILDREYGEGSKKLGGNPMSVIVAAGPYTVDSDLEYAPLGALLENAEDERPDVLVLLGPFVDAEHPLIKVGDVDQSPEDLFRSQISARLATLLLASPRTNVILIPNGRDMTNAHVAYPQSPFSKEGLGLPKGVRCLPNPTTFSINEVVFAMTSVDVLFSLRNQEFFRKCGEVHDEENAAEDSSNKDVMSRTCRHLLRQRSFYPIFPAPLGSKTLSPLNLDITHNDLIKMGANGTSGADVVILPSMLKHFTRIVDSTIMVNPSFLTRGEAAGTFARFTVHPMNKSELEQGSTDGSDEMMEHRVYERCRVDIVRV